jgi:DNA-binding phage protein
MQDMGVVLTTSESAVFQLLKTSTNPHFKSIIKLIKETNLETNDFRNDRML